MGRPSKFLNIDQEYVRKLYLMGFTDRQVADYLDVTEQTVNNWKKAYPDFFDTIKRAKLEADAEVVDSLRRRAMGYDKDGHHYPPDSTALALYLNNRVPQVFRNQKNIDHTTNGKDIVVSDRDRAAAKDSILSSLDEDDNDGDDYKGCTGAAEGDTGGL